MSSPDGRQLGNHPETGLEEIDGDLFQADFWPSRNSVFTDQLASNPSTINPIALSKYPSAACPLLNVLPAS
jgi:hypothetical protein